MPHQALSERHSVAVASPGPGPLRLRKSHLPHCIRSGPYLLRHQARTPRWILIFLTCCFLSSSNTKKCGPQIPTLKSGAATLNQFQNSMDVVGGVTAFQRTKLLVYPHEPRTLRLPAGSIACSTSARGRVKFEHQANEVAQACDFVLMLWLERTQMRSYCSIQGIRSIRIIKPFPEDYFPIGKRLFTEHQVHQLRVPIAVFEFLRHVAVSRKKLCRAESDVEISNRIQ